MKIRSGFISNSSSSSFTCDVCGETKSGWDLSHSDAGMDKCENNHTFCQSHKLEVTLSIDEMREALIANYRDSSFWGYESNRAEQQKHIAEYQTMSDADIEEHFEDLETDGCHISRCPICQMDEIADYDIVRYALIKFGVRSTTELASILKKEFGTYDKFIKWINDQKV